MVIFLKPQVVTAMDDFTILVPRGAVPKARIDPGQRKCPSERRHSRRGKPPILFIQDSNDFSDVDVRQRLAALRSDGKIAHLALHCTGIPALAAGHDLYAQNAYYFYNLPVSFLEVGNSGGGLLQNRERSSFWGLARVSLILIFIYFPRATIPADPVSCL